MRKDTQQFYNEIVEDISETLIILAQKAYNDGYEQCKNDMIEKIKSHLD